MPIALPKTQKAVQEQKIDVPGFDETTDGALYKFGHDLTYRGALRMQHSK